MLSTYLQKVIDYVLQDTLKVVTQIVSVSGIAGGIVYWINLYRNRTRIRICIHNECVLVNNNQKSLLEFEAECLGGMPTSLEPMIILSGYSPKRKLFTFEYTIENQDRSLSPYVPKKLKASTPANDLLPHLWYKTYCFVPTRGRSRYIRIRNSGGAILSRLRFSFERLAFRLFGRLPVAK